MSVYIVCPLYQALQVSMKDHNTSNAQICMNPCATADACDSECNLGAGADAYAAYPC